MEVIPVTDGQHTLSSTENYQDPDSIDPFKSQMEPWEDYAIGIYISIAFVIALFLNCVVLWLSYERRRGMHPVEGYLVMLAAADLLHVAAFVMPMSGAFSHRWILGDFGCKLYAFVAFFTAIANTAILTVMSVIRVLKTCYTSVGQNIKKTTVVKSLVGILLYSVIVATAPLLGWGQYGLEPTGLTCSLAWESRTTIDTSYVSCTFVFVLLLPVLVMSTSYGIITRRLYRTVGQVESNQQILLLRARHMTKMTVLMCVTFIGAWGPYAVTAMWAAYGDPSKIPMPLNTLPPLFAKTSVCLNPIIYYFYNDRFRRTAKAKFKRIRTLTADKPSVPTALQLDTYASSHPNPPPHILPDEQTVPVHNTIAKELVDDEKEGLWGVD